MVGLVHSSYSASRLLIPFGVNDQDSCDPDFTREKYIEIQLTSKRWRQLQNEIIVKDPLYTTHFALMYVNQIQDCKVDAGYLVRYGSCRMNYYDFYYGITTLLQ